jgi:hypothetical protein
MNLGKTTLLLFTPLLFFQIYCFILHSPLNTPLLFIFIFLLSATVFYFSYSCLFFLSFIYSPYSISLWHLVGLYSLFSSHTSYYYCILFVMFELWLWTKYKPKLQWRRTKKIDPKTVADPDILFGGGYKIV